MTSSLSATKMASIAEFSFAAAMISIAKFTELSD